MKKIISLNGLDKSGKSTQAGLLKNNYKLISIADKLSSCDGWPNLKGQELFNWWFIEGETENVTSTIYGGISQRNKQIRQSDCPLTIIDRGNDMFDGVCIATTMIRENLSFLESKKRVYEIKSNFHLEDLDEEKIFYQTGENIEEMVLTSRRRYKEIGFSQNSERLYDRYQNTLASVLSKQLKGNIYSQIIDGRMAISEVYQNTEKAMREHLKKGLDLSRINLIVGIGGMSESGKSSLGEYLQKSKKFERIKIKDIIGGIEKKYQKYLGGNSIYEVEDTLLSTLFLEEISKLQGDERIVIESLHNYGFTKRLKEITGDKFKIVYVETPKQLRIKRNSKDLSKSLAESKKEVERKDKVKQKRGTHLIKGISDIVLQNKYGLDKTKEDLIKFLEIE